MELTAMPARIKITRKGCFNSQGQRIPVGTVLTLDREPKGWVNKYLLLGDDTPQEDQTLETGQGENEDPVATQEPTDTGAYDPLEPLRQKYRDLTGNEPDKRWGYPKLTSEIAELEEEEDAE
jgi:hypothetical protein